jgi:hypothetical protein
MQSFIQKIVLSIVFIWQMGFAAISFEEYEPYYAGPLISLTATPIPVGQISTITFIPFDWMLGYFDQESERHAINHKPFFIKPYFSIETGITDWMDMRFDFPLHYGQRKNTIFTSPPRYASYYDHAFYLGDVALLVQAQFLKQQKHTLIPSMLIYLKETFPSGKYDHLSPTKSRIDASGEGIYQSTICFNMEKVVWWFAYHPINFITNFGVTLASRAHVHGFHVWGGGYGTNGYIKPADLLYQWNGFFSIEYSINQNWVFNAELLYYYYSHTHFHGTPGYNHDQSIASNTLPTRKNIDLTATIEYSFDDNYALMLGMIYTVWGKNTMQHLQAVLEINAAF